ncbi:hypothetical protein LCGC14_2532050 [marine sediment metagenome]|uniref:Response regulatory domain-containing protein n=1 Tax=marine sediment metagenome TaxID=412755 RepID=A0A0F9AT95_9ZZZZ
MAANGRAAVDKAQAGQFDLILMDIQMPEMDGYEATAALRQGGFDAPIIALTAHALASDRQRCLDAGCTDYLSKPIDRVRLVRTVTRHARGRSAARQDGQASGPSAAAGDGETIRSQLADDPDLAEIIGEFVADLGNQAEAMRQALAHGHHGELRRLAHQIKGAGGSYGYPSLTDSARELERAAKAEDTEAAVIALRQLELLCQAIVRGRAQGSHAKTTEG